jgi:hypothetical protein
MSNVWTGVLMMFGVVLVCVAVPYIVYVSVKLAGYGWLKGRHLFFDEKGRKNEDS